MHRQDLDVAGTLDLLKGMLGRRIKVDRDGFVALEYTQTAAQVRSTAGTPNSTSLVKRS